ncbi:MAG: DUF542 domain-containing protein [Polyangiaceae bacterium]
MDISVQLRLRELASAGAAARGVLERAGLDYCCEGNLTLAEACEGNATPIGPVVMELRTILPETTGDLSDDGLSKVLDRVLVECHPRTTRLLAEAAASAHALAALEPEARALAAAFASLASHV